jgi:hypothetical protein
MRISRCIFSLFLLRASLHTWGRERAASLAGLGLLGRQVGLRDATAIEEGQYCWGVPCDPVGRVSSKQQKKQRRVSLYAP